MPQFGLIHRRDLIVYPRRLGFDGPYPGKRHEYMERGVLSLQISNPHRGDISVDLLARLLRQADISRSE